MTVTKKDLEGAASSRSEARVHFSWNEEALRFCEFVICAYVSVYKRHGQE